MRGAGPSQYAVDCVPQTLRVPEVLSRRPNRARAPCGQSTQRGVGLRTYRIRRRRFGAGDPHGEASSYLPSDKRKAPQTAARPPMSCPTIFANARTNSASRARASVSYAKLEKVVKPPKIPMKMNVRSSGQNTWRDSLRPPNSPIKKQPERFTQSVPTGNDAIGTNR